MKLTFLGTRGEIEARTDRHAMHSALLVTYRKRRVMLDCGADWLSRFERYRPHAIVLTHAHPDHAHGLRHGAPCAVHATEITWRDIDRYPIEHRRTLPPRRSVEIGGIRFTACPVEHSIRCPAVCHRVTAGRVTIVYAPDVAYIPDRGAALRGARLYIGDGATLRRSMIRRRGERLFGHAPVRTQLTWCRKENVSRAIFTHCGSPIVRDEEAAARQLDEDARQRGVEARIAHDGVELVLR